MRVVFVPRSVEIKPLFSELRCTDTRMGSVFPLALLDVIIRDKITYVIYNICYFWLNIQILHARGATRASWWLVWALSLSASMHITRLVGRCTRYEVPYCYWRLLCLP